MIHSMEPQGALSQPPDSDTARNHSVSPRRHFTQRSMTKSLSRRQSKKKHPCIGRLLDSFMSPATGYREFNRGILHGLARIPSPREIRILALKSDVEGTGAFRQFVKDLQGNYQEIRFLCCVNEGLIACLARYGFVEVRDRESDSISMIWRKP